MYIIRIGIKDSRPLLEGAQESIGISGNMVQSVEAEHASNEMDDIDWTKVKVMDCHPHYRQRRRGTSKQNTTP